jgi:hypothetical protein
MATASTEARRAAVRALAEEYMRIQAEKKEAGELRMFLESVGWSRDMAIRITEGLEIYDVNSLQFLERADLEELGLSEDDKLKLLRLAATARNTVACAGPAGALNECSSTRRPRSGRGTAATSTSRCTMPARVYIRRMPARSICLSFCLCGICRISEAFGVISDPSEGPQSSRRTLQSRPIQYAVRSSYTRTRFHFRRI